MAEMSTSGAKTKAKGRSQKEKQSSRKKSHSKQSESLSSENSVICISCSNVFTGEDDKLMECERCDCWFCIECLDMSELVYNVMVERKDSHWFCSECEKPAITAVKTDKEIEERCAAYMSSVNNRLEIIEKTLDRKVDREHVNRLEQRMESLENNNYSENTAQPASTSTINETLNEQKERENRAKNIILFNIPESSKPNPQDRTKEDTDFVTRVFQTLEIEDYDIDKCIRLGKKVSGKSRLTRVTLKSQESKGNVLRKSRALENSEDFSDIYIRPDLTRLQRTEQRMLRDELRSRRDKGEDNIFIRRGKIIQTRDRAPHWKGGTSGRQ